MKFSLARHRAAHLWTLAGLALLALNLRAAVTGVPPLLDDLQRTLGLSGTQAGLLTTLPVLCLGLFASLAPPLARRAGGEAAVAGALALLTTGILVRALPSQVSLFTGTVLAGAGIALGNVLLPAVVKRHFAGQVGPLTGLAMMLMAGGGAVAAGLAVPLYDHAGRRVALAVWAAPALAAALLWAALAARRRENPPGAAHPPTPTTTPAPPDDSRPVGPGTAPVLPDDSRRVGPGTAPVLPEDSRPVGPGTAPVLPEDSRPVGPGADPAPPGGSLWRSPLAWAVAGYLGMVSLLFYALTAWLPEVMRDRGVAPAEAGAMVSVMQLIGIPLGLAVPVLAARRPTQRSLVTGIAVAKAVGLLGVLLLPQAAWLWICVLGTATGSAFPLAFTLLTLRSPNPQVAARLSGMAQAGGYLVAAAGPLAVGLLHGVTGGWAVPLLFLLVLVVPEALFGLPAAGPGFVPHEPGDHGESGEHSEPGDDGEPGGAGTTELAALQKTR
ncbi:MFS transporter [Streptomyces actinomycinicus]|uniref:MFS transporter n=1 Tax=Streptomyces actinomycinicus TaxID=1695166 RepID=A0A937JJ79_9ACTN|nr:MFS transporter [Streptomyces actinomycinicus]MBL1081129.1 MFS transporter [Streptomyces actinomycinicus]